MKFTSNQNLKRTLAKTALVGCAILLSACTGSDPFRSPKHSESTPSPMVTPIPVSVATRPSCDSNTVLQGNIIVENYRTNYVDGTGIEIGRHFCEDNDKETCPSNKVVRGVRLMALGLILDKKCIEILNCNASDENRESLNYIFQHCRGINTLLMGNIVRLSPTGKGFGTTTAANPKSDYGYGGYITNLITFEEICKNKKPEDFPPPRIPSVPPEPRLARAIWMGVPIYFANISDSAKAVENARLKQDLTLLCETYKNRDKEEYCSKFDPDILYKCEILNMNPEDVIL